MRFVPPAWGSHKSSHRISHDEQMRLIQDAIERDDGENDKGAAIIVVVDKEARARQVEKKWKKHRWQLWKRRPFVPIATNKRLQNAIAKVSCNEDVNHLTIIACEGVDTISPQVYAPHIRSMRILQCGRQDHLQKVLDIGDAFSFNNKHRGNCACRIGYNGSWEFDCTLNITFGQEKSSVPLGNEEYEADSPSGTQETKTIGGWWKSWRGFVASAVGLVVAAAKAVFSVTIIVKGYCLSLSWKSFYLYLYQGSAAASLSTSAACVAVGYGLVAFLVVYFVPWGDLFNWFDCTAQSWYNGVLSWWNRGVASGRRGREYSRVI